MGPEIEEEKKIPRTMSTQHPDNVNVPEWSSGEVIDGNAEIFEAYFAYETLGCHEVMWDAEGKDVDTRVVRKLLTQHKEFFTAHTIGKDIRLTYRIPNPRIEVVEKKVFVETLQNIPVAYDVASSFYRKEVAPIFEVILPFTTEGKELIMLYNYYKKVIIADADVVLGETAEIFDEGNNIYAFGFEIANPVFDFHRLAQHHICICNYHFLVVVVEHDEFFAFGCEGKNHLENWCDLFSVEGRRHIIGYWYVLESFNKNFFLYNFNSGIWNSVSEANVFSDGMCREKLFVLRQQFPYDACVNIFSFSIPHNFVASEGFVSKICLKNFRVAVDDFATAPFWNVHVVRVLSRHCTRYFLFFLNFWSHKLPSGDGFLAQEFS